MFRRAVRLAVNGLCLLSLLACLAAAWLCWRGRSRDDVVEWSWRGRFLRLASEQGEWWAEGASGWPGGSRLARFSAPDSRSWFAPGVVIFDYDTSLRWNLPGVRWISGRGFTMLRPDGTVFDRGGGSNPSGLLLPSMRQSPLFHDWFLSVSRGPAVVLLAVPPALWLTPRARRAVTRWRRRRRGLCVRCGYDLTANASGRCPECGEAVEGEKAAA